MEFSATVNTLAISVSRSRDVKKARGVKAKAKDEANKPRPRPQTQGQECERKLSEKCHSYLPIFESFSLFSIETAIK